MTAIRVLIVDDHRVFAESLATRLALEPDVTVVGTANNAETAITALDLRHPDVTIVDIGLGRDDGIDLLRQIRAKDPDVNLVVVTGRDDWRTALEAVRAGASAFVTKGAPTEDLIDAVHGVMIGESRIPPALLTNVLRALQEDPERSNIWRERLQRLTPREYEVLELMVRGLDRTAIAQQLYLSLNTVRTHTKNILAKLDSHSSLEAVSVALRAGMRPPASDAACWSP